MPRHLAPSDLAAVLRAVPLFQPVPAEALLEVAEHADLLTLTSQPPLNLVHARALHPALNVPPKSETAPWLWVREGRLKADYTLPTPRPGQKLQPEDVAHLRPHLLETNTLLDLGLFTAPATAQHAALRAALRALTPATETVEVVVFYEVAVNLLTSLPAAAPVREHLARTQWALTHNLSPAAIAEFLAGLFPFRGFKADELNRLTLALTCQRYPAPVTPSDDEGAPAPAFRPALGVVWRGQFALTLPGARQPLTLEAGEVMPWPTDPNAPAPEWQLRSPAGEVLWWSADHWPTLAANTFLQATLNLLQRTREHLVGPGWDWLNDEKVWLITGRHPILLVQTWLQWVGLPMVLSLIVVGVLAFLQASWVGVAGLVGVAVALASLVIFVDWRNDWYIVTNRRVIYIEKVFILYESRQTLTLSAVTGVRAATDNPIDRLVDSGDVTVTTLSKPMVLRFVPYPQVVAALVEAALRRVQAQARASDLNAMRAIIESRIYPQSTPPPAPARAPEPTGQKTRRVLGEVITFRLREDDGENITYRRHWWKLWRGVAGPLGVSLVAALVMVLGAFNPLDIGPLIPPYLVSLVALVVLIPALLWLVYQYLDWKNDLFRVTPDQLTSLHRRPLGSEQRDTANLDNIQALNSAQPTLLSRVLNFGTVTVTIPGKEMTLDGVYDPRGVQEDIQRRIEALKIRKAKAEADRRRQEYAEVMSAYYLATTKKPEGG